MLNQLPLNVVYLEIEVDDSFDVANYARQYDAAVTRTLYESDHKIEAAMFSPHMPTVSPYGWSRSALPADELGSKTLLTKVVTAGPLASRHSNDYSLLFSKASEKIGGVIKSSVIDEAKVVFEKPLKNQEGDSQLINLTTLTPLSIRHNGKPLTRGHIPLFPIARSIANHFRDLYLIYTQGEDGYVYNLLGSVIEESNQAHIVKSKRQEYHNQVPVSKGDYRDTRGQLGEWTYRDVSPSVLLLLQWGEVTGLVGRHTKLGHGDIALSIANQQDQPMDDDQLL